MEITEALETILGARYGRDVRQAIHDGIKQAYEDAIKNGNANMEVSQARGSYPSLAERLASLIKEIDTRITKGQVTMVDLTQEVKEALTGGSVAVVGKNAVLEENIVDGQVTPFKTSFISESKDNLLDKRRLTNGYYNETGDAIVANATYWANHLDYFIPITPLTNYTIPYSNKGGNYAFLWYDESKQLICKETFSPSKKGLLTKTPPANSAFLKISFHVGNEGSLDSLGVYKGYELDRNIKVHLSDNHITPSKTTFLIPESLADATRLTEGYYNETGDAVVPSDSGNYATNNLDYFIPVKPLTDYTMWVDDADSYSSFYWYDADKHFIGKSSVTAEINGKIIPKTKKSPDLAHFMKVATHVKRNLSEVKIVVYEDNGIPPKYRLSKDIIVENDNLVDVEKVSRLSNHFYIPNTVGAYDGSENEDSETITVEQMYAKWDALISENPNNFTKKILGRDASDTYDIWEIAYKPTPPIEPRFKISMSANIHGNGNGGDSEDAGITLYELLKAITAHDGTNEALNYMKYNVQFNIIPIVNPWGFNNRTRLNSNGVDLNRDFNNDNTQIETDIIKGFMHENSDSDLYIDVHCWGSGITPYNLHPYYSPNTDSLSKEVVYEVGEFTINRQNGNSFTTSSGTDTKFTDSYSAYVVGVPAITCEFPTYAEGKKHHGSEMMNNFLEFLGNLVYRASIRF